MRHMLKISAPIFVLFAAVQSAFAYDNVSTFTLDNGLEAVVIEDHRASVVVHMLWYRVGSADEPVGKSGIAHYLEHLMFKGTDDLEPGEFSAIVEAQGGSDNAFTSFDYTGYFQRVASDRLALMMEMEADRMRDLRLDDATFTTERDVVLEERAQRTDSSPGALLREQQAAAQFLNHPYARPIIGWRDEIETLSLQDALDFYKAHYAPNNAILIVAGDVTPEEVKFLAEEHYGPIAANPNIKARMRPQEPIQLAARKIRLEDERTATPYVVRSYLAPNRVSGDQREAAALTYLAALLGGNSATSLMGQMLEQENPYAVYTGAGYGATYLDPNTFSLVVVPTPDRSLEQAEADLDAVIARFLTEGVDPDKLERLKVQTAAAEIYERDSLMSQAQTFGRALTAGLSVQDVKDWPTLLRDITAEEIEQAAERLFAKERSVTGYLAKPSTQQETQK